ncbi:KamA family radical SAM protein [Rhodothermus profundi]|uniref:L-lysine 2,3-aminomutase n=1 Tax=Rhodothermus profundi TaxID=633813 RepID=A0A1M6TYT6_9BACT|nr:KamA family radical SAM protein [Rhodothermus profundi]SHK62185.1 L-lysine 2,3-aminomutase [Rhodothermus profundi]
MACPPFDATHPQWRDWRWQMRHRIHSAEELAQWIRLTDDERRAIEATRGVFRWNITPYYARLMDPEDPNCPIRRQVVPRLEELAPDLIGVMDPLEEVAHSPVKNLIHNYQDRVAFCVTSECAIYCRYCLRKRMVGDAAFMMRRAELQAAIDYIAAHPEIRDVLLTGGDPLTLSETHLAWILDRLRAIPHVEIIRIGTRMPVKLPYRITPELCQLLERYHPLWINTHFNHPKELTPDAAEAIDRLLRAGIPVGNQTVLLRGINDQVETMKALCEGLVRMRVRPYYLYQAQLIGGTAHFRTPIEKGMAIIRALQGRTTGFAIPKYVLDTPYGKVPLDGTYVRGRAGDYVIVETPRGVLWAEPNPIPEEEELPFQLPEIPWPEEVDTIKLEKPLCTAR